MDNDDVIFTPIVSAEFAQAIFLELATLLVKKGVLTRSEISNALVCNANEQESEGGDRNVVALIRILGTTFGQVDSDGPSQ